MAHDNETLAQIHRLANERGQLYRLAGKSHLTADQRARIDEITGKLPMLWDQHRREVAGERRALPRSLDSQRAA